MIQLRYTCPDFGTPMSVPIEPPLHLTIRDIPASGRLLLFLENESGLVLLHDSRQIQDKYLFLEAADVRPLYEEAAAELKKRANLLPERINLDALIAGLLPKYEPSWVSARPVSLLFPKREAYRKEAETFTQKFLVMDPKLLMNHRRERLLLMGLLCKYAAEEKEPEQIFRTAALMVSYSRTMNDLSGAHRTFEEFMHWFKQFFEPSDMTAIIEYSSKPYRGHNSILENALNLVLYNIPAFKPAQIGLTEE